MEERSHIYTLIKAYLQDTSSPEEKRALINYIRKNPDLKEFPEVEEILAFMDRSSNLDQDKAEKIYHNILSLSREEKHKQANRPTFKKYLKYAVAAIFIGFGLFGYFNRDFIFQPHNATDDPTSNFVRIDFGNEKSEILNDSDSTWIEDIHGNIVGRQHGNSIVYNKTDYTEVIQYNTLMVPHGKKFELSLSDGTRIHLNAGTSLKYPVSFQKGKPRKVFLNGEAFFEVTKDVTHPFIVQSQDLNVEVYGTSFNVSAYPEESQMDIVLVEGEVGLYDHTKEEKSREPYKLFPGDMGSFNKSGGSITGKEVDTDIYTAWIKGELIFRNMTFENILKKLERKYNYTIINNNDEIGKEIFNANFGAQPVEQIMQFFERIYGVDYTIKGTTIYIN